MTAFARPPDWTAPSGDPNDRQFGDVVEPTTLEAADAFDVVLVGEPYDGAVIGRTGAREGPSALREALSGVKTHHFELGDVDSIGDMGDVASLADPPADVGDVQTALAEVTGRVHALDAFPVFLGGDNSLTYANVAPLLEAGRVGVVNFDAHLDVREVRAGPTSGTPYRQLLEAGLDGYVCVGARHFETSGAYADSLAAHGGSVITAEAVADDWRAAVDHTFDALGDVDALYVSVDLDVLDGPSAPGVSAPTPGGLPARELFRLLRRVGSDRRVAGFEIVECAPPLDPDGRTAAAGARAVAHFLAGRMAGRGSA